MESSRWLAAAASYTLSVRTAMRSQLYMPATCDSSGSHQEVSSSCGEAARKLPSR